MRFLLLGLPLVSKFLNEELGGMTIFFEKDPNMNMKRAILIIDGSTQILTLTQGIISAHCFPRHTYHTYDPNQYAHDSLKPI